MSTKLASVRSARRLRSNSHSRQNDPDRSLGTAGWIVPARVSPLAPRIAVLAVRRVEHLAVAGPADLLDLGVHDPLRRLADHLPVADGVFLYLATVLDIGSRRLVGWSIADHMRTELVIDALEAAARTRGGHPQGRSSTATMAPSAAARTFSGPAAGAV